MKNFEIANNISVQPATFGPKHHFFGYYDKSPWDISGRYMLGLETDFIDRLPDSNDKATIGLIDLKKNNKFKKLGETKAWNWQQGCMLQWLPPGYNNQIIYNDLQNNKFVSVILNVKNKKKKILPLPIYAIHPNGKYALTLNFSRLCRTRRSYGYAGVPDIHCNETAPKKDGIFILNLRTGKYKLIISIDKLHNLNHVSSMENTDNWVNHIGFNRDGSRFCFFHRWQLKDETTYTRLLTSNLEGSDISLLADGGNYTHHYWRNSKNLLCWGCLPNRILRLRQNKIMTNKISKIAFKIYHHLLPNMKKKISNSGYIYFTDKTKKAEKLFDDEDGHCSFSPDGNWILTDSYPDKKNYRKLILYNFETKKKMLLGKFYSLPNKKYSENERWDWSEMRCDLHPRWNRDGTKVCIDSVHEGNRQMHIIDLKKCIKNNYKLL